MKLDQHELARYQRQIKLDEIGLEGQTKLKNARVLIVGAGGLGAPCSLYLASCGVGTIGLIDPDRVSLSNLHRQILYRTEDCGQTKVIKAKEMLQSVNENCRIDIFNEAFTENNALDIVENYDVVADCSDNFATRYLVSDACVAKNKINVSASVQQFQGQLVVFSGENGPCYRCVFADLDAADIPNCNEAGVLGVTPGVLGTMQAAEIIKTILKLNDTHQSRFVEIDLLTFSTNVIRVNKSIDCVSCAQHTNFAELKRPVQCVGNDLLPATVAELNELMRGL